MYVERPRRRGVSLLLLLFALALCGVGTAPPASAHTRLVSSTPSAGAVVTAPPTRVTLRFSEAVSTSFAQVKVLDADGGNHVTGRPSVDGRVVTALVDDLADGRYRLAYRVVSADGHPVSDELTFTVDVPARPTATATPTATTTATPTTTAATATATATTLAGEPVAADAGPSQNTWIWVGTGALVLVLGGLILLVLDRRRTR